MKVSIYFLADAFKYLNSIANNLTLNGTYHVVNKFDVPVCEFVF